MTTAFFALVATGRATWAEDLELRLERALPFEAEEKHLILSGAAKLWVFSRDAGLSPVPSFVERGDRAAAIVGYGIGSREEDDGELLDASHVLEPSELESLWQRYHGEWSACRLTPRGLEVVGSRVGTEPVHYIQTDQFVAISNRAR